MKKWVFWLALFVFGCTPTNKENIKGIWVSKDNAIEFMENGKAVLHFVDRTKYDFNYSFIKDEKILFETDKPKVFLIQFNENKKVLILTDEMNDKNMVIYSYASDLNTVFLKFQEETTKKEKSTLVTDLYTIGSMAQQYYRKPAVMNGGGNSFKGFNVPRSLQKFNNAYYEVKKVYKEKVILIGILDSNKNVTVQATVTPEEIEIN